MQKMAIGLIRGYRLFFSPIIGCHCRFNPSCSQFALTAVKRYGALYGSVLAISRILRCHPLHPGGYDPVPKRRKS